MKQVLLAIVGNAVGVVIFLLIVYCGALGYSAYTDKQQTENTDTGVVFHPEGLKISQHSQMSGTDLFTVNGVLENAGNSKWFGPKIVIKLSASDKSISECESSVFGKVLPHTRHPFQIQCRETSNELPFPVSYKIEVRDAIRDDG